MSLPATARVISLASCMCLTRAAAAAGRRRLAESGVHNDIAAGSATAAHTCTLLAPRPRTRPSRASDRSRTRRLLRSCSAAREGTARRTVPSSSQAPAPHLRDSCACSCGCCALRVQYYVAVVRRSPLGNHTGGRSLRSTRPQAAGANEFLGLARMSD